MSVVCLAVAMEIFAFGKKYTILAFPFFVEN